MKLSDMLASDLQRRNSGASSLHSRRGSSQSLSRLVGASPPPNRESRLMFLLIAPILFMGLSLVSYIVLQPSLISNGGDQLLVKGRLLQQQQIQAQEIVETSSNGLIMFQACNGFANQRLSIVFGILAGILSKRDLLLPKLPLNGEQREGGGNIDGGSSYNSIKFSRYYDVSELQKIVAKYGLQLYEKDIVDDNDIYDAQCGDMSVQQCLDMVQSINKTINIGCGFPANLVTPDIVLEYESVFLDILTALTPVRDYRKEISQALSEIHDISGRTDFNMLHLRIEDDWIEHCEIWSNIPDGIIRDNCMGDMETIGVTLAGMIEDVSLPLVMSYNVNVDPSSYAAAIQSIRQYNFKIITNDDLGIKFHSREVSAMLNYFMGLSAQQFIGNTVSSFSALMILERRVMQKWASYYNGGNIPMQVFVPLYQMPWVLVDECRDVHEFQESVLPVLIQGMVVGQLDAYLYCFGGRTDQRILNFAKQHDFKVIQYNDVAKFIKPTQTINQLYPVVMFPWLKQYNYIFVTSANVWFERQVSLDTFGLPLPKVQTDYILGHEESARVRLIKSQYIRELLVSDPYVNQKIIPDIQDGGATGVVSYISDSSLDTPINCYNVEHGINKWGMIRSCQYKEYQQLAGHSCNQATII